MRSLWLALLLFSCSAPPRDRLDIQIKNFLPHPVRIRAATGILQRTIQLEPGERWTGWVPRSVAADRIQIKLEPLPNGGGKN